ncbi:MAG: hypothetical protein AAB295_07800, partial [Chloroflexota bacterium]
MATPTQARTHAWLERDATLWSPALGLLGLVAGMSTRAQGSMAGSHPGAGAPGREATLEDQARNRDALARPLGFDGLVRA